MKTIFYHVSFALLATTLTAFSFPTADDPEFKKLFEIPDEVSFTTRFGSVLLDVPQAELPRFREALATDFNDKKLVKRQSWRALALTDTRWAESDVHGFVIAAKANLKGTSALARLRAAVILLESDIDAAIQTARDLNLTHSQMSAFTVELAGKKPELAFSLFKERAVENATFFDPDPMFIRWTEMDSTAAWNAIGNLKEIKKLERFIPSLRKTVSAKVAEQDLPTALRLIDSLDSAALKKQATGDMVATITETNVSKALEICTKLDDPAAWQSFAHALQMPTDQETIRMLQASLPAAQLEQGLTAFFTRNEDPVMPAFYNARLIGLMEDPVLRGKIIIAVIQAHIRDAHRPLPAAFIDTASAMMPELFVSSTPVPVRTHLLTYLLERKPMAMLPWIISLSDAEWSSFDDTVISDWAEQGFEHDIPELLAHAHPRAKAIGKKLLDNWLRSSPAAAFPIAAQHAPDRIAEELRFSTMHEELGKDFSKLEAMIESIADPEAKTKARLEYLIWSISALPPKEAMAKTIAHIAEFSERSREELLNKIAWRKEPEFDQAVEIIPGLKDKEKDSMRALRARSLLLTNQEQRAFRLLKEMKSDSDFFPALYYMSNNGDFAITDWDDFLAIIAVRPDAAKQKDVVEMYARKLVETQNDKAPQIAARITNQEFRTAFATAVAARMPARKNGDTWERAMQLGLNTEEGRSVGVKAIRIIANENPKSAIATLLQSGPDAMRNEFVQPVMEKFVTEDPAAAFKALQAFPEQMSKQYLGNALREWVRINPRAACEAALSLIDDENDSYVVRSTIDSWLRQAPDAARAWVLSLATGKGRQVAITSLISYQSTSSPTQAAELFHAEFIPPLPASPANQIAQSLALNSYQNACRFLVDLDGKIKAREVSSAWQKIVSDWYASDPELAGTFLKNLPETEFSSELLAALASNPSLPKSIVSLPDNAQKTDPLRVMSDGKLYQKVFTNEEFADLKQAIITSSERTSYLSAFCVYLMHRNMHDQIPGLLRDARDLAAKTPNSSADVVSQAISAGLEHLQKYDPPRIPAYLDSLAAISPEFLESAVSSLWTYPSMKGRISPLMASSLLRLPSEKRAALIARAFSYYDPISQDLLSLLGVEETQKTKEDPHNAILIALAKEDLPLALSGAVQLPVDHGDSIVRAILAAFPSRKEADQAIKSLPNELQARAQAWHDALNPEGP